MEGTETGWTQVQAARTRRKHNDKGFERPSGVQGQSGLKANRNNLLQVLHRRLLRMVPHAVGDRYRGERSDSLAIVVIKGEPCHMGADVVSFGGDWAVHGEWFRKQSG